MSMSLLRKFGKSNPPLHPTNFWLEFVQELSIILRKRNPRLRQGRSRERLGQALQTAVFCLS